MMVILVNRETGECASTTNPREIIAFPNATVAREWMVRRGESREWTVEDVWVMPATISRMYVS